MAFDPSSHATPSSPMPPPERWDRCRHHGYRHHHRHHRHHGHGIIPGLVLVAWGALLLLRERGVIDPALRAMDFWPLVIIGVGLTIALGGRLLSVLVGAAVTLLGAGMLAQRLGYAVGMARLWPILLIAVGIGVILNSFTRRRHVHWETNEQVSADELQRSVTMGGLELVVDSQRFRGGALAVTMGEIKADLRRAAMAGEEAALDLSLTMGGIELYVPSNWQVVNAVSPFMGVVEDKTEPRPDGAGVQRRLVLRGKLTMGAVTITN